MIIHLIKLTTIAMSLFALSSIVFAGNFTLCCPKNIPTYGNRIICKMPTPVRNYKMYCVGPLSKVNCKLANQDSAVFPCKLVATTNTCSKLKLPVTYQCKGSC